MEVKYTDGNNDIPVVLTDHPENPVSLLAQESQCVNSYEHDSPPRNVRSSIYEEDLKAVFTIDGEGYDVVLSVAREKIFWMAMSALGKKL